MPLSIKSSDLYKGLKRVNRAHRRSQGLNQKFTSKVLIVST